MVKLSSDANIRIHANANNTNEETKIRFLIFDILFFILSMPPSSSGLGRVVFSHQIAGSNPAGGTQFRLVGAARSAAHGWRCAKHDWPSGDENTPYNLMEVKYKQTAKVLP